MDLYFAWSLFKYIGVAIVLFLMAWATCWWVDLFVNKDAMERSKLKRWLWKAAAIIYAVMVALSINTTNDSKMADKTEWSAPVLKANPDVVAPRIDHKSETKQKFDEQAAELVQSVVK